MVRLRPDRTGHSGAGCDRRIPRLRVGMLWNSVRAGLPIEEEEEEEEEEWSTLWRFSSLGPV